MKDEEYVQTHVGQDQASDPLGYFSHSGSTSFSGSHMRGIPVSGGSATQPSSMRPSKGGGGLRDSNGKKNRIEQIITMDKILAYIGIGGISVSIGGFFNEWEATVVCLCSIIGAIFMALSYFKDNK